MNTPPPPLAVTQLHIRLEQCLSVINDFSSAQSTSTDIKFKVSVLSCLIREYKWLRENKASQFCSVRLPVLQSDPMKRRHLGRWSSKQAGSERRCPRVHSGQIIFTLSPLCFLSTPLCPHLGLTQSLGRASASLCVLAGGAFCLGGRRGPRVSFWKKKRKKMKICKRLFYIKLKEVWHF